jgi:hypothetical protein
MVIDVDVPREPTLLTVNCVFNPDSLWTADISQSIYILDEEETTFIANATVVVYENNVPITTLVHKANGRYQSPDWKPEIGKSYKISAAALNYPSATSFSTLPNATPIHSVEIKKVEKNHSVETNVKLKFIDDPAVRNYYQVLASVEYEYFDYGDDEIETSQYPAGIESLDPLIQKENEDMSWDNGFLFTDTFFDGKETEISFRVADHVGVGVRVRLRNVSEDFYKYMRAVQLQRRTEGNPLAQPVNVFNNIDNGFGIFASYTETNYVTVSQRHRITNIVPASATRGEVIVINIADYIIQPNDHISVMFMTDEHSSYTQPFERTESSIKLYVPPNAVTDYILVSINGRLARSEEHFVILD